MNGKQTAGMGAGTER